MVHFPQLLTGCIAHYPSAKLRRLRTIVNEAVDGHRFPFADLGAREIEWDLSFSGLTQTEADTLEAFFSDQEGRLRTFVFADPLGNLLARSEELTQAPWARDPLLQFTGGVADPFGGTRATRVINAGAAAQSFRQVVNLPGIFETCLSLWARSTTAASITVRRTAGASSHATVAVPAAAWKRLEFPGSVAVANPPTTFEVELESGAIVELFAFQLEAQAAAGGYQPTTSRSGVYPMSRFAQDEITLIAEGPDAYSARIRIVSAVLG
jgi:hypothetical protein